MGRGSARASLVVGVGILCLLVLTESTLGAMYTVGGSDGWGFNVTNWPTGKSFKVGDVLAFNYAKDYHSVVRVGKRGYKRCTYTKKDRVYRTGQDKIKLRKGKNFFICGVTRHCQGGMKIAVSVAA